ncbi:MAG: GNAT family N-acetyltransferase, partial [Deltaproteobacteria bacterium]|nr:GNAT family N-acetyltransferase [Deltaproteobacteria bacterium]
FMPLAMGKGGFLGGRVLTFCASSELYSDHLDMISSRQDSLACLETLWDFLKGDGLSWESLVISTVSSESALFRHASDFEEMAWEVREKSAAPYIDLSAGFDAYMSAFNGKHRYTLKKKARRLSEQGFSYAACAPGEIEAGVAGLFELHRLRAVSKGIDSTFNGEKLLSLHKAASMSLSGKGRLWLRFLQRDGTKIAAFYGFELGGRLFYYQFGIDPHWEPWSPGTVLMYNVIEEAFSKGLHEFDFLRGDEAYKSDWANKRRTLYSMKSYRKSIRGNLSRTAFRSMDFLKKNVRSLMS